jgi:hypothetical protein
MYVILKHPIVLAIKTTKQGYIPIKSSDNLKLNFQGQYYYFYRYYSGTISLVVPPSGGVFASIVRVAALEVVSCHAPKGARKNPLKWELRTGATR